MLEDWRTAPVSEKMRAMLGFLEKVTLSPGEASPSDAAMLRQVGISEKAIEEALYVCFLFNLMSRLADAFDFPIPTEQSLQEDGRILYRLGYWSLSVPG